MKGGNNLFFKIAKAISIILLIMAVGDHPYSYFEWLRLIVCATSVYGIYIEINNGRNPVAILFGIIAVLFNPVLPVHLSRATWLGLDLLAALVLASIFFFDKDTK